MRSRRWLVVTILLVGGEARAQAPLPSSVFVPKVGAPRVQPAWTDAYVRAHYSTEPANLPDALVGGMFGLGYDQLADPFPDAVATALAGGCNAAYAGAWDRIHCAAWRVDLYLNATQKYRGEGEGDGARSFCRDHAHLFQMVFNHLEIPGATLSYMTVEGHIVNRLLVLDQNGHDYSYVIDTGWSPDDVFPYGPNAREYAQAHPGELPPVATGSPGLLDPFFQALLGAPLAVEDHNIDPGWNLPRSASSNPGGPPAPSGGGGGGQTR